jgi:PDZ domain
MLSQFRKTATATAALAIALLVAAIAGSVRGQGAGGAGAGAGGAGSSGGASSGGSASGSSGSAGVSGAGTTGASGSTGLSSSPSATGDQTQRNEPQSRGSSDQPQFGAAAGTSQTGQVSGAIGTDDQTQLERQRRLQNQQLQAPNGQSQTGSFDRRALAPSRLQVPSSLDQTDPSGLLPNNGQQSLQARDLNGRLLPGQDVSPRGTAGQQRGLGQANALSAPASNARTNYYNAPSQYATGIGGPANNRPMMGIDLDARYPNAAVVGRVHPGLGADNAGLLPGDTIRAINNIPVASPSDLINSVARLRAGDTVQIAFVRPHHIEVILGPRQPSGRDETSRTAQQGAGTSNDSMPKGTAAPTSASEEVKTEDSDLGSVDEKLKQLEREVNSLPADKGGAETK